jgi:hypothetical protein
VGEHPSQDQQRRQLVHQGRTAEQTSVPEAKFTEFKALKSNSGSGWDPLTGCSHLSNRPWVEYVKVHPGAKEFQSRPLALYEELREIFDVSVATGWLAVCSHGTSRAPGSERDSNLASEEFPGRSHSAHLDAAGAQSHGSGGTVADTTEGDGLDVAVAASIPVADSTQLDERCARALGKRKGVTTGDRVATALEMIADEDVKRAGLLEQKRTAVDRDIADFLTQFGAESETRDRVQQWGACVTQGTHVQDSRTASVGRRRQRAGET